MLRRIILGSGIAATSLLLLSGVAVGLPATLSDVRFNPASGTFTLTASSATVAGFAYDGTATLNSAPVLVFTAGSLSATGASLNEPCWPLGPGGPQTRESSSSGAYQLAGSVTIAAVDLSYTGLPSAYTVSNPPAAGTVLPGSLSGLKIIGVTLVAADLTDQHPVTVVGGCG